MSYLFTIEQERALLANGLASNQSTGGIDHFPVVKLFTPDAGCTWLLSEIDPDCLDQAFGLCDLGVGFPELGYVSIAELHEIHGQIGLPIERDRHFTAKHKVSVYADIARKRGVILT